MPLPLGHIARALAAKNSDLAASSIMICGVSDDSRSCRAGDIFVAIPGTRRNGLEHVEQAIKNGAIAVATESAEHFEVPSIIVSDARAALSALAAMFYEQPSRALKIIGITGTNGKTTTNWMIFHLLEALLGRSIRIGTLGVNAAGVMQESGVLTTPGALEIHRILADARQHGIICGVLEASSHALAQRRCDDIEFDIAVFTNLTQDHLDYHHSLEQYFIAKRRLFELLVRSSKLPRYAVINISDPAGKRLHDQFFGQFPIITYGWTRDAMIELSYTQNFLLAYKTSTFTLPDQFIGKHNAENLAAAFAVGVALGFDAKLVIDTLATCPQVPGRLERIAGFDIDVLIDFAHTPDALENVLRSIKAACRQALWVVFGCGGDRDRGKRPQMGAIASRLADHVIVTSDNPRSEDAAAIVEDVLKGCPSGTEFEVDRKVAIERAVSKAAAGDVLLIAGKGHEEYQIIGDQRLPFSDRAVALAALAMRECGRRANG